MNLLAATRIFADVPGIVWWVVGFILVVCIVYAIMRQAEAPAWMYKWGGIAALVLLLLIVLSVFF